MKTDRKKLHKKIKIGTAIVGVALIGCVVLAVSYLPRIIGDTIQTRGSDSLRREVSIATPVDIDWHWGTPRVTLRDIKIANIDGAKEPLMVDIEKAEFTIKIWKLLLGRTELPELRLTAPKIVLEKKTDGTANWNMPELSEGDAVTEAALPDDRHDFPVIGALAVTQGTLAFRDEKKGLNVNLELDAAEGESGDKGRQMQIKGKGTLQDSSFVIEGNGGSLEAMRDSSKPYPLELSLAMGATKASLSGTFKDPVQLQGIDAKLTFSGNNLADLFYLTGIPLPPTPAYKIEGQLGKDGELWSFKQFTGEVGGSDLSGDLTYDTGGARSMLKGNLHSNKMDVADLGGFIGMEPVAGTDDMKGPAARVLPDVPLNLKRLRASDMDVTLKADKLIAPNLPFNSMNVRFLLDNGLLKLDPMRLSLAQGEAAGSLILNGRNEVPHVTANIDLRHLQLAQFFKGTRFEKETNGTIAGRVALEGDGLSLAKVLGNSNGNAMALMTGGRISLLLVEAADIDLAEAAPLFLGDDKTTEVRCAVADFDINKGLLASKIFILDTSDTNVKGDVKVDLRSEKIDAELDARPKDPSPLALQSPILVKGSLKNPKVSLEPVRTGLRAAGAAALGAVLTPLAAILPFIETGSGKDSNCRALINTAQNN